MNLSEAFNYGVYFLSCNGVDEAEFKSLCLSCHCAGIKNSEYATHKNDDIIMKTFADLLWRVKSGEPLQYVLSKWDFYDSEFYVGKGVLIPRPETEELVEKVINEAKKIENPVIFDLCSGSGCIGISIAKAVPNAKVYCVEKSEDAFKYLEKNAKDINNVTLVNGDICDNKTIDSLDLADIIVSNPPYIKSSDIENLQKEVQQEPRMALDGGEDGLYFYKKIAENWKSHLKENGYLFLEIGDEQGTDVTNILNDASFCDFNVCKDMSNNDRMVIAKNR